MSNANISLLTLTVIAAATLAANRFVETDGGYPTAGGLALGVTRCDGVAGDPLPVDVLGTAVVQAGAAIGLGVPVMVAVDGKVIPHDGDGAKHAVGRSLEAVADGELVEILLVPTAGVLVTAVYPLRLAASLIPA